MTHQVTTAPQQHPTHRHESVLLVLALVFLSLRSLNYCPAEMAEIAEIGLKAIDDPMNAIYENIVCIEVHEDSHL